MKQFFFFVLLFAIVSALPAKTGAQTSTPISGSCVVEPMSQAHIDELATLAATPATTPTSTDIVDLSKGLPVDAAIMDELNQVVRQAQLCAYEQDLPRLLSLFTDRFIVEQFFGTEPVTIVQTEKGTPTNATPAPMTTDQEQFVMDAVLLPDGRIAAHVSSNAWGGNPQRYLFAQQDGRWLIDQIDSIAGTGGTTNVTIPADANAMVVLVLTDAGQQWGVLPSAISIESIEAVEWPDSSLGCPVDGDVYAPVISSGYRIIVTDGSQTLEYHTGPNDVFVHCAG